MHPHGLHRLSSSHLFAPRRTWDTKSNQFGILGELPGPNFCALSISSNCNDATQTQTQNATQSACMLKHTSRSGQEPSCSAPPLMIVWHTSSRVFVKPVAHKLQVLLNSTEFRPCQPAPPKHPSNAEAGQDLFTCYVLSFFQLMLCIGRTNPDMGEVLR